MSLERLREKLRAWRERRDSRRLSRNEKRRLRSLQSGGQIEMTGYRLREGDRNAGETMR